MQFLSIEFLCFLTVTSASVRACPPRWRSHLLLITSYLFYCTWSVKMAAILLAVTVFCYFAGLWLVDPRRRAVAPVIAFGAVSLLTLYLVSFKVRPLLHLAGNPLLPLGISYYVFRLISYLLDVYWGKCDAVDDFVSFAAYVAFFPQMIAGPIQRASSLIPQLQNQHAGNGRSLEGLVRMALGFAKKSLVADNLGLFVGWAYGHLHSGSALPSLVALYLYPLQLYADFSGLADIAIGAGLLLGIEAPENFDAPFTAQSITEFWRRWHITLTSWIRDYVFIPLRMATRNLGNVGLALSLTVNMVLIGLWHGFTLGFLAYGLFQGVFLVGDVLTRSKRHEYYKHSPALTRLATLTGPIFVYHVIAIGSVFFRAPSMGAVTQLFAGFGSGLHQARVALGALTAPPNHHAWVALPAYALTAIADGYRRRYGVRLPALGPRSLQWSAYACVAVMWILIALTLLASEKGANPFVYAFF